MRHVKRHGPCRSADVQHGDCPFQLVVSGLVEDVAEPDHASSLTREVHRKPSRTAAKHARYRVQFLAAIVQVIASDDEICGAEGGTRRKQRGILAIPESMALHFRQGCGLGRLHDRDWFHRSRLNCFRPKQRGGNFLADRGPAQSENCQQD